MPLSPPITIIKPYFVGTANNRPFSVSFYLEHIHIGSNIPRQHNLNAAFFSSGLFDTSKFPYPN